jgi:PPK2 family polyphosphate:nucleotide phosphotransferase
MPFAHKIQPGATVQLSAYDTRAQGITKEQGEARFAELLDEIDVLQEELYAAGTHSVLVILQGLDTSGKDGTIRKVLQTVDPQGCRIEPFKVPTEEELAHDFLWRAHKVTPRRGMMAVFNRSYYEDVLVVRVHDLVPKRVWEKRYDQINDFERLLAASDTIVLKFFLHISKDEQEQRLMARERELEKAWKLAAGDWKEREHWTDYIAAYEEALTRCTTQDAPWYVVPADQKWFRNIAVAEVLAERLKVYRDEWRAALETLSQARLAELEAYRNAQQK